MQPLDGGCQQRRHVEDYQLLPGQLGSDPQGGHAVGNHHSREVWIRQQLRGPVNEQAMSRRGVDFGGPLVAAGTRRLPQSGPGADQVVQDDDRAPRDLARYVIFSFCEGRLFGNPEVEASPS